MTLGDFFDGATQASTLTGSCFPRMRHLVGFRGIRAGDGDADDANGGAPCFAICALIVYMLAYSDGADRYYSFHGSNF